VNDLVECRTGAIVMIIQCPNCGFSGKIPKYAFVVDYQARCKRCGHQFELSALVFGAPREASQALVPLVETGTIELDSAGDPGSSSYELKAITDDFSSGQQTDDGDHRWTERESVSLSAEADRDLHRDSGSVSANGHRSLGIAARTPASLDANLGTKSGDPWYSRVLQAWGVLFLIWALLIVVYSLPSLIARGAGVFASPDTVSAVVSVLLLVPGAAGLFLLVDLGRFIRGLRQPSAQPKERDEKGPAAISRSIVSWAMHYRSARAARTLNGR
jgi:hypothetical protein